MPLDATEQKKRQPILQHNPSHPQRRAPQRVWVLRPCRLLVDRPERDEHVELVGQRHADGDRVGGHAIGGAEGLVMFLDGGLDRRVLALEGGVVAAHEALQFGELADRLGGEVGLGKDGGTLDEGRDLCAGDGLAGERRALGIERFGDLLGQRNDALHALALRAELGMEGDAEGVELGHALVERFFQVEAEFPGAGRKAFDARQVGLVGLPEIEGVGQPRAHHLAVAAGDVGTAVAGLDVGDEQEVVGEGV